MNILIAMVVLCQQTPGDLVKQLVEAVEKKDAAKFSILVGKKLGQEEFNKALTEAQEGVPGELLGALKKCPSIGALVDDVSGLVIEYRYPLKEGGIEVRLELAKKEGAWRLNDARSISVEVADPEDVQNAAGPAKEPVSDAIKGFIAALEKKDWKKVWEYLPEQLRQGITQERIAEEFEGLEQSAQGNLFTGLKKMPAIVEPDPVIIMVSLSYSYGKVHASMEWVKEKGSWLCEDCDVGVPDEEEDDKDK